jgi:hypothetical protein
MDTVHFPVIEGMNIQYKSQVRIAVIQTRSLIRMMLRHPYVQDVVTVRILNMMITAIGVNVKLKMKRIIPVPTAVHMRLVYMEVYAAVVKRVSIN